MQTILQHTAVLYTSEVYIPPWFNADALGFVCAIILYLPFTFHPGSMQTCTTSPALMCHRLVYIPPWFNADQMRPRLQSGRLKSLHSTLVQCRPNRNRTSSCVIVMSLHSTLVQCRRIEPLWIVWHACQFTFHPGSMQTKNFVLIDFLLCAFTFHPGSMQTRTSNVEQQTNTKFTFHPGSMQTHAKAPARVYDARFTFHPGSMQTNSY